MAIIVIRTALKIEINAAICLVIAVENSTQYHLQEIEKYDTLFRVRGSVKINRIIIPTTPQTIEQVTCPVIVLKAMIQVKIWLPMIMIKKII
jgi:hypothetical protein